MNSKIKKTITEPSKEIPIIGKTDVVVIGSGMAGSAAAIAAARNGVNVTLIEKENCPGGLATLGLVWYYLPLCDGKGNKIIGGLGEELLKVSIKYGPGEIPTCWKDSKDLDQRAKKRYMTKFNPASFIISMEEFILENNIEILYDSRFCDVVKDDEKITAVIIENKSGRCAVKCRYVVDATGDADVCYMAGEDTVSASDNKLSSWFYSNTEKGVKEHTLQYDFWKELPKGVRTYSGDDHRDVTDFSIDGRKDILDKTLKMRKKDKDFYPILIPTIPQFRMTRRLVGLYTLKEKEIKKYFTDTVGFAIDRPGVKPIYCVPFRSMEAVKVKNLIAAGRCISAEGLAWNAIRSIGVCALTGEVAGTAAALAVKQDKDFCELDVGELQNKLKKQDVIIDKGLIAS